MVLGILCPYGSLTWLGILVIVGSLSAGGSLISNGSLTVNGELRHNGSLTIHGILITDGSLAPPGILWHDDSLTCYGVLMKHGSLSLRLLLSSPLLCPRTHASPQYIEEGTRDHVARTTALLGGRRRIPASAVQRAHARGPDGRSRGAHSFVSVHRGAEPLTVLQPR
jgi:hypothetical protein